MEVAGRTLTATFSDLADQANGSVLVKYGETVVLATAVMSKFKKEGLDYFPLTVEYEEKFYAAGRILGGRFMKREGRPSDEAILTGRIVDRTIRPLFEGHIRNEIQVVTTVLSIDPNNDPDTVSVIAASLALATSNIPWGGPASAVRLGLTKNDPSTLVINPTYSQRGENAVLDLLVCGKDGNVNMIESEASEITEEVVAKALEMAVIEIEKIQDFQKKIITEMSVPKTVINKNSTPEGMEALFSANIEPELMGAVFKEAGNASINELKDKWLVLFAEKFPESNKTDALDYYEEAVNTLLHKEAIENDKRPDGRKMDELRNIYAQADGISSIVHGVGVFYRGGTHVLTVLTLSGPKDSQLLEGMEVQGKKYFMHHYNFPPFSVGETGRVGSPSRRSVGHGALAEKSLRGILPDREKFPYTIRLVSEALASNGSSSMGSVCASTLAMMDGGVPIKRPAAGIAVGLMSRKEDSGSLAYKVLTDIQGPEDHHGDMDFKVAGTTEGITGIQLDIKVDGIPVKVLAEAMTSAKKARLQIIEKIVAAIPEPRAKVKESAPTIISIKIDPDKIGMVIGSGGKTIQKISADTGAEIEIEDDGSVFITGKLEGANTARTIIEEITHEYKPGEKFTGEVTRLMDFGAFVKISSMDEGLVHISELASFRVDRVADVIKVGDKVPVMVKEIDEKGRINLSIKRADPNFIKAKETPKAPTPQPPVEQK